MFFSFFSFDFFLKNLILPAERRRFLKNKNRKETKRNGRIFNSKKGNFWTDFQLYSMYVYIYIYAVELKTGPIFAFSSVKNWSKFFFVFLFLKISFSLQKEEDFSKTNEKYTKTKDPFLALKTGPILLRNILGPVFNASLDQFLTLAFLFCFVFFFSFGGAETPIFIVFQQKCKI